MKKKYIALLALSLNIAITANADTSGWVNNNGTWSYLRVDGTKATGWLQDGGNWYFLQSSGAMKIGWLQDGGNWYYLNSNGAMAHDTTVDGYYLSSTGAWTNNPGTNTSNTQDGWTCPQIKSSATSDVSAGFKILHDELGFGYTSGWAGYSPSISNPTNINPVALSVVKYDKALHNSEIMIKINSWANDPNIKNSNRIQPIAKQMFKFYFTSGYETMMNDLDTIYHGTDAQAYALLDHVVTIDGREVLFTCPQDALMIWISSEGEHITQ
jgi:FOG: Glucan-binding domain (YG repeat)